MTICPPEKCTGCGACANACPKHSILLEETPHGELHPVIDEKTCVQCRVCVQTCPSNTAPIFRNPKSCFAAWNTDVLARAHCASGGIGTLLAEYVIRYKHGVVFGVAYDAEMVPRTLFSETLVGIEAFKGSKYVQSIVSCDTFQNVEKFLSAGRFVLYIGTPCQVAGLKSFLRNNWDNLITVDLICHGVSPTRYFQEEIDYSCHKNHIKELADVRFRGNDGNNFCLTLWRKDGREHIRSYRGGVFDYYLKAFLMGISLRTNCYKCPYARPERVSDITIGDFIGLGESTPFPYPVDNVSSVTLNTETAVRLYADLSAKMPTLMNVQREYKERLVYRPSLLEPFPRHPLSMKFRNRYLRTGFPKAVRMTLTAPLLKVWIQQHLRYIIDILRHQIQIALKSLRHLLPG